MPILSEIHQINRAHFSEPVTLQRNIQINAHQSMMLRHKASETAVSFRVCENDGDPLISEIDLRLSGALFPFFSPPARIFDEDREDWALIACTHSVNNGIVLETLPPSHLPATHAGSLSSIFAIFFPSMQQPRSPTPAATSWRKRGYLLESSR